MSRIPVSQARRLKNSLLVGVVLVVLASALPCLAVELFGPHLGLPTGNGPTHAVAADFDGNGVLDFATADVLGSTVSVMLGDGQGGFELAPAVPVPGFPVAIATGDFNADGAADLVVAHVFFDALSILLGDGEGGFSLAGFAGTGEEPVFVAAGDFDFDGTADLAVANSADDTVTVMLGDGSGGFTATAEIPVGTFPRAIAVADLSGDGVPDLAVANAWSDSISILRGDGLGGFETGEVLSAGEDPDRELAPVAVAVEDFDLDGDADLAVANGADDSVNIFLGDGQGGFGAVREFPEVGDAPVWLAVDDFDDDGDPDVAVTNLDGNSVTVLRGDPERLAAGDGGFTKTAEIELEGQPRSAVASDLTGDGITDLAVVLAGSAVVTILPGDGLGGFGTVERIPEVPLIFFPESPPFWPACVVSGDFDGDSHADLAVNSRPENAVIIYPGDGLGGFRIAERAQVEVANPHCMAVADLDGDGDLDMAVPTGVPFNAVGTVRILLGDGQGGLSPGQEIPIGLDRDPIWAATADFDLDGDADLATANERSNTVSVLLGNADGSFSDPTEFPTADTPTSIAVADINGDGAPDLAVTNFGDGVVSLHLGDGGGNFGAIGLAMRIDAPQEIAGDYEIRQAVFGPQLVSAPVSGPVELADDGDGTTTDACQPLLDSFDGGIVLVDRGSCTFTAKVKHAQEAGAAAVIVATNHHSIATMQGTDPTITIPSVMISRDHGDLIKSALPDVHATLLFRNADKVVPVGDGPIAIASGNFDENGPVDLAVANREDGTVSILTGDGSGGFNEVQRVPVGESPISLAVADLNLDGLDDLAFALRDDHSIGGLINGGAAGFVRTPVFYSGRLPRFVTAADLDEDGAPDLVASNVGSDSISIFLNQIEDRVDPNGSNRVDGFDVAEVSRLSAVRIEDDDYRRTHDVDLNGVIDGDDLALVVSNFGRLMKQASPLRATLVDPLPSDSNTITLQQREQEGDRVTVDVLINDDDDPSTAAEFAITFEPVPGEEEAGQVLEAVGFEEGDYFLGGLMQDLRVNRDTPGRAEIRVTRLPGKNRVGTGQQRLLSLILEAKRVGAATLDFAPIGGRSEPSLLNTAGNEVPGVRFVGGVTATVGATRETTAGQRIGFAPALLDLGAVPAGVSSKKMLRLANSGFADLVVLDVASTRPEFASFFTSRFTIPPFGSVELPVQFSPTAPGVYAGELIVTSDDPERPVVRAPVLGRSELSITVTPIFVDFGAVAVDGGATRRIGIGNRGNAPLVLTSVTVSHAAFASRTEFALLNPGEFGVVEAEFHPTSEGDHHGVLTLGFDAPAEKKVVLSLAGSARDGP